MQATEVRQLVVPPRLYAIVATEASVAIVFRRGPSKWWHIGRWDLATGTYEPGAWLRGQLYPRRSDISPDGELLLAFVLKTTGPGFLQRRAITTDTYVTVSKLPWFYALAAWREGSTWGGGYRFVSQQRGPVHSVLGEPGYGDAAPLRTRFGVSPHVQGPYAVELERGWTVMTEEPRVVLTKAQPNGGLRLELEDASSHATGTGIEGRAPRYRMSRLDDEPLILDDVVWADWGHDGRLLTATTGGWIRIHDARARSLHIVVAHDLGGMAPDPQPAPARARVW